MKGGAGPGVRRVVIGLAFVSAFAAALESAIARAQPFGTRPDNSRAPEHSAGERSLHRLHSEPAPGHGASDLLSRDPVPPDLDQRRRDGHMTPEERRLLRQHIEDAVRELYKR